MKGEIHLKRLLDLKDSTKFKYNLCSQGTFKVRVVNIGESGKRARSQAFYLSNETIGRVHYRPVTNNRIY